MLKDLLETIIKDPKLENKWLKMLSHMEFIGLRKLVKSISYQSLAFETLRHIHEESYHSFLLASLVLDDKKCPTWLDIGWSYMQGVDRGVSDILRNFYDNPKYPTYGVVSFVIEERVLKLYPIYFESTKNANVKRVLTSILAQEKNHHTLYKPFLETLPADLVNSILGCEEKLWDEFLKNISMNLSLPSSYTDWIQ